MSNLGSDISMPNEAFTEGPHIIWNHVDGPLMYWAGQDHWLTWGERLALFFGRATEESIARKHWPHTARIADKLRAGDANG